MREDWAELVGRARDGDRKAFAELVDRFKRPVCAVIYPIVKDWHLTQDVAQDSFVAAFEGLPELRDSRHFRAWLFAIARRRAASKVRKASALPTRSMRGLSDEDLYDLARETGENGPAQTAGDGASPASLERVREVIMNLPNEYGTILLMHHVEGMPLAEMARALDRSHKAVKAVLYRARVMAREYLTLSGLDYQRVFDEL